MLQKITQTEALFIVLNAEGKHVLQSLFGENSLSKLSRSDEDFEPKQKIAEIPIKLCSLQRRKGGWDRIRSMGRLEGGPVAPMRKRRGG